MHITYQHEGLKFNLMHCGQIIETCDNPKDLREIMNLCPDDYVADFEDVNDVQE